MRVRSRRRQSAVFLLACMGLALIATKLSTLTNDMLRVNESHETPPHPGRGSLELRELGAILVTPQKQHELIYHNATVHNMPTQPVTTDAQEEKIYPAFDPNLNKYILILAYQRVSSSFFGSFFDKKESLLYIYEPIDAVYMHLYGTQKGWAVPTDLHYYPNGTSREFRPEEIPAIQKHLKNIFTCSFNASFDEFFVHEFWSQHEQKKVMRYKMCLKKNKLGTTCMKQLTKVCPPRIGLNLEAEEYCMRELAHPTDEKIVKYKQCTAAKRYRVNKDCFGFLQGPCDRSKVVMVKTVRLHLESVVDLLQWHPNFRIIHLFRDPRSVVLSRIKADWSKHFGTPPITVKTQQKTGRNYSRISKTRLRKNQTYLAVGNKKILKRPRLYADSFTSDILLPAYANEARLYCDWLEHDLKAIANLPPFMKDKVYQVVSEELLETPMDIMKDLHNFLQEPLGTNEEELEWIRNVTNPDSKSQEVIHKWMNELSAVLVAEVNRQCKGLFQVFHNKHWKLTQ